jgi:hypothetical protein
MSFDFAGTYKAKVMAFAQATLLAQIQKELVFSVQGLGDMALPVAPASASSISWAENLRDRDEALPLFDKNLAQTVPPSASLLFALPYALFVLLRPSSPASLSQPTTNAINSLDNHVVGPLVMRATHNRCLPTRERPTGWACSRACSSASRAGGSASGRR